MNFRDRNYMRTSSSTESLRGSALLSKMLGILRGKRVPTPHAELVTVVNRWDEKAGLRRDAVRSQVIDVLEAQEIKETGNEEG